MGILPISRSILMIHVSPLERLKIDPVASAQARAWYARLEQKAIAELPKRRREDLARAQRVADARRIVIG